MAQFYAETQGSRGPVTRTGTKQSGMTAHIRGWDVGVRIECQNIDGKDVITVYRTGGSNSPSYQMEPLAIVADDEAKTP